MTVLMKRIFAVLVSIFMMNKIIHEHTFIK
jgi:hypothetical protein